MDLSPDIFWLPKPRCGGLVEVNPLWYYRDVPTETLALVGVTLFLIAVLSVVFLRWNYVRSQRRRETTPVDWILDPGQIESLFQTALMQRSKIEMQFHAEDVTRKVANCSLDSVEPERLTLELSGRDQAGGSWVGRRVDCYFRLSRSRDDQRFFHFESEILEVRQAGPGVTHLALAFPDKLIMQQKRAHLRVEPPYEYVLGLAMWPEARAMKDPGSPPKAWGRPIAVYMPDKQNALLLANISAGGARLTLKRGSVEGGVQDFFSGGRFVLLLDLYEPEKQEKFRYLLQAVARNRMEDVVTRDLELGVQFERLARPGRDDRIEWREVEPEPGVEALGNWVMKRHLERYREKSVV